MPTEIQQILQVVGNTDTAIKGLRATFANLSKAMTGPTTRISISGSNSEEFYPRKRIDQKRGVLFAENSRDNFTFEPIEVEPHPTRAEK